MTDLGTRHLVRVEDDGALGGGRRGGVAGAMVGDTVALERMKQVTGAGLPSRIAALQARPAESLSWYVAEAGDAREALFWIDRCVVWARAVWARAVWARAAGWSAMVSYTFVRRSMMALTFSDSAVAAVREADLAAQVVGAPASVRALAAKQAAYGYALAGQTSDCARALDASMLLSAKAATEDD